MGNPRTIGGIQPFAELARHGPVVVYKGYQAARDRFVLLKVLKTPPGEDEERFAAFAQEAHLLSLLHHPQIVSIYDYGREEAGAYIVAEFVDGMDLGQLIARGPLPVELALYIFRACLMGLQDAQENGVLHRDLKPENILVSFEGLVKLADFGMASLADEAPETPEVRGTWGYLAPEQILGAAPTAQGDLFALGATLYEMLLGRPAFVGATPQDVFEALLHHDPTPYLARIRNIPEALKAVCATLLAKTPAERYPNCAAVLQAVEALALPASATALKHYLEDRDGYLAQQAVSVGTVEPALPLPVPEKHRPAWFRSPMMALMLVLLTAAGGYTAWQVASPPDPLLMEVDPVAGLPGTDTAEETRAPMPAPQDSVAASPPAVAAIPPPERPAQAQAVPDTVRQPVASPLADALVETSVPAQGLLDIICTPWAEVSLNGERLGTTPFAPVGLPVGTHTLQLHNPDFPPYETTVTILPDETQAFRFSFWSLVGRVTLHVSPWAEVYINGQYRDTTPQDHPLIIAPGTHALKLIHPQLGTWETTLHIEAAQTYALTFNLNALIGT